MHAIAARDPGLDLPTVIADAMVDTGLFDALVKRAARAIKDIPKKLVGWLGPEARTPSNSPPPNVSPAEAGLWNGVVFVEANEASFWVLVRANAGRQQHTARPDPYRAGQEALGDAGWRGRPRPTADLWPDALQHEPAPWDGDPWRR